MKQIKELLDKAHTYFLEEKYEEAQNIYEDLLYNMGVDGPDRIIAEFEYSWVLYRQKRYDEAIAVLSKLKNADELTLMQKFDAVRLLGFAYIAKNNFTEAIDILKESDKINLPDNDKKFMLFELGKALFIEGSYNEAFPYFERVFNQFDAGDIYSHSAAFYEGFIYLFQEQLVLAIEKFTYIIENASTGELLASGLFGMAHVQFKNGRYEELLKVCEDILKVYPEFHDMESLAYFTTKSYFMLEQWGKFKLFFEQLKYNFPDGKYQEEYKIFQEKYNELTAKDNTKKE
ncbi:MAG: tetratricopeptide repeat protein [Calditrichia bacterium]|nr:tetratricopeptide repeat protein [Calditrichia bacterium]